MPDVIVPAKPKTVDIPLDLQAAAKLLQQLHGKSEDKVIDAMVRAGGLIAEAATSVKQAHDHIMGNAMGTPMANLSNARKRVREVHDSMKTKLADLRTKIDAGVSELEASTLPKVAKDTIGAIVAIQSAEIRTALRAMPQDQRLKLVRGAIEQGDAGFVHAVIDGNAILTGMGTAEQAVARDMWQRKWHHDTMQRIAKLRTGQQHLDRLSDLFTNWSAKIYAEKDAAIAAAEKSAELADKAMAKGTG